MKDFDQKINDAFEKAKAKSAEMLKDKKKTSDFLNEASEKLKNSVLGKGLEEIPTMIHMVKSYVNGEYKSVPLGSIVAILGALLYWVAPFDIIPDTIPGFGQIDDGLVTMACLACVKSDIDDYKRWESENKKD